MLNNITIRIIQARLSSNKSYLHHRGIGLRHPKNPGWQLPIPHRLPPPIPILRVICCSNLQVIFKYSLGDENDSVSNPDEESRSQVPDEEEEKEIIIEAAEQGGNKHNSDLDTNLNPDIISELPPKDNTSEENETTAVSSWIARFEMWSKRFEKVEPEKSQSLVSILCKKACVIVVV